VKAVILAAGYGRRMRPLTDNRHKTLLDIGDDTIIGRIIDGLVDNNVLRIVVVTGYLRDELVGYLTRRYPNVDFEFVHNADYATTNNIHSMALAFDSIEIDSDIVLLESDLIFEPQVLSNLLADDRDNVALVDRYRSGMDGTVVTVEDGAITDVISPHRQGANFDFSDKYKTLNIYKFAQGFVATEFRQLLTFYAQVIDDNVYYELMLGILIYMQRQRIDALLVDGRWAEVDDPNDLESALFVFDDSRQVGVLEDSFGGYWNHDIVDFCFIRNMYFPNGSVISELRNNLDELLWNYGSRQSVLNQKLAYYLLCDRANVLALNGAAQVYPVLGHLYNDKRILCPTPTFGEYERVFTPAAHYQDDGETQVGDQLSQLDLASFDLVVIVNPNNPTGSLVETETIASLARSFPDTSFLVDESFIEFSNTPSLLTILEDEPLDNIIVLKSLSKSLGVPGARLGYMYTTNTDLLAAIAKWIPIWNMNSVAENFMEILLKHRDTIADSFDRTRRDRDSFVARLEQSNVVRRVLGVAGNFVTCELEMSPDGLAAVQTTLLNEHRTYIKDVSDKFVAERAFARFAVRLPAENSRLVDLLDVVGSRG